MPRYRIELATRADDADLRRILAETPIAGQIAVSFCREPSYFAAAVVEGRFRQVIAARDTASGRLVGFGTRSVRRVFVNGRPESIGYLSSLRLLPEHRRRGLLARGFAFLRKLHQDGRTPLYLTTVAEGNDLALEPLTSGRAGLPIYHQADALHTLALPCRRQEQATRSDRDLDVRPARAADLTAVLDFLGSEGPRRQFFPCYEEADFFSADGLLRDLRPEDLLLAFRGGKLIGTVAAWDQHAFRQAKVVGYSGMLHWLRPAYNLWSRMRGLPGLPRPGQPFRFLLASLLLVHNDDPAVFSALLRAALRSARQRGSDHLLVGLCDGDPMLPAARNYPGTCYTTRTFHVCWQDGETLRTKLDGRPTYVELGSL